MMRWKEKAPTLTQAKVLADIFSGNTNRGYLQDGYENATTKKIVAMGWVDLGEEVIYPRGAKGNRILCSDKTKDALLNFLIQDKAKRATK